MLNIVQKHCEAYANDTTILSTIKNFYCIFKLQSNIHKVCKWSKESSSRLNENNCGKIFNEEFFC